MGFRETQSTNRKFHRGSSFFSFCLTGWGTMYNCQHNINDSVYLQQLFYSKGERGCYLLIGFVSRFSDSERKPSPLEKRRDVFKNRNYDGKCRQCGKADDGSEYATLDHCTESEPEKPVLMTGAKMSFPPMSNKGTLRVNL